MLFLASSSPRRRELLQTAGISFQTVHSQADESHPEGMDPEKLVLDLAARKARAALETLQLSSGDAVLGADTVVALEGRVLGKPSTPQEAFSMLSFIMATHSSSRD